MTHITDLPGEILCEILLLVTKANQAEGERFSYGLSQIPATLEKKARITKYVRGPLSAECLRWDATQSIRQVCGSWHDWALSYNLEHVFERRWRGAERWADLPINRQNYPLYELNERPMGYAVYRDPFGSLRQTDRLFTAYPTLAHHVRRLWFNGFHTAETDRLMLSVISQCTDLLSLSVPWTALRRGTAQDWKDLLNKAPKSRGRPLHSLELTAVGLTKSQAEALEAETTTPGPLADPSVDFSSLKRLKIFGNTPHEPINDADLSLIARTATGLEHLDLTNLSTISVAGMLALVRASHLTLQVLEHSPRSDDGFFHPFPGHTIDAEEHVCELLTSLPKLRDLSISVPFLCEALFQNHDVNWTGECQVRTTDLCGCDGPGTGTHARVERLRKVFAAARHLVAARRRVGYELAIEIFFAGCIFEPEKAVVHGDFAWATLASRGSWPASVGRDDGAGDGRSVSTKGPYGTSGVWDGKEDGALWDAVSEEEYLRAIGRGWITL